MLAGWVDAIAGGGGLIALPALLAALKHGAAVIRPMLVLVSLGIRVKLLLA